MSKFWNIYNMYNYKCYKVEENFLNLFISENIFDPSVNKTFAKGALLLKI